MYRIIESGFIDGVPHDVTIARMHGARMALCYVKDVLYPASRYMFYLVMDEQTGKFIRWEDLNV